MRQRADHGAWCWRCSPRRRSIHFRPGAIDHHNAQIVLLLAVVLLTSQIERSAVKAALGGVAASLSLAIGIEMLPAIAAIGLAVFGLLIWRGASVARQAGAFGAALAASSLLLAPALLPLPSLASQVCDAFGGPVLLLLAGGGVSLVIMAAIDRYPLGATPAPGDRSGVRHRFGRRVLRPVCRDALRRPTAISIRSSHRFGSTRSPRSMSLATMPAARAAKSPRLLRFSIADDRASPPAALMRSDAAGRFRWILGVMTLAALIGLGMWEMRVTAGGIDGGGPAVCREPRSSCGRRLPPDDA